ncbi:hypothetical protein [Rubinisphaera margarita]|uniref:hypothetical protein n=1 Tax=Rubinisphaera margarita TaxID=2909586 RepID=UPI001EE8EF29|nr:hypothetical protein [Rubinisphaera margarita]MCG6154789.1 hypothetical protein [Rubinisphaera margarita]
MKSPFAVFRKHQKVLMVALTGLAMFAFIVLDSLTQNMAAFPPIFGALVGVGLGWLILRNSKYTWVALTVGGVAGALIGLQFQTNSTTQAAVTTSFGSISEIELQNAARRRETVNQFLVQAFRAAHAGEENPQMFMLQSYLFGGNGDPQQEALMHMLMMREADKVNFYVSDQQVSDYISQATANKLSGGDYVKILRQIGLSDSELFNLIREQIASQSLRRELMPRYVATPENFWDYYQKMNVRQELATVSVAVEAFKSEVGEPTDEELKALFDEHREKFPSGSDPGFRQPPRVKLAYLEVDYDTVAKTVKEVTDEEVKAYYEANKEDYRNQTADPFPSQFGDEMEGLDDANPFEAPGLESPMLAPGLPAPVGTDTPAIESGDLPGPVMTPPANTSESSATPTAPPQPESTSTPAPEGTTSAIEHRPFGNAFALIQDQPTPSEGSPTPASTSTPAPASTSTPTPESTSRPAPEMTAPAPAGTSTPAPATTTTPPPATTSTPAPETTSTMTPPPAADPLPEFQPLDEALTERIRAQIKRERVMAKINEITQESRGALFNIVSKYANAEDDNKEAIAAEIQKAAQAYAKENKLRYVETPFLSPEELQESEDHPIGSSTEPISIRFQRENARTVVEQHFSGPDLASIERQRYLIFEAEDPSTLNRFLHWQVAFKPQHVPTWDEDGVKEQVQEAWNAIQARELARKRAEKIAETLRNAGDKTWKEALADVTETGKEGGQKLNVAYTSPFTWLTRSSAANPNPFAPPPLELPELPMIYGGISNEFMETVFRDLEPGQVGVTESADGRYLHVVRVDNRTDLAEIRASFLAAQGSLFSPFSPFQMMTYEDSRDLVRQWNSDIYEKYEVKWVGNESE